MWRLFWSAGLIATLAKTLLHHSEFQYSICNEPLIELSNPGASSSWFYLTSDDEFIIKTVQHKEAEFLQKLLPGYYMVSPVLKLSLHLHEHHRNPTYPGWRSHKKIFDGGVLRMNGEVSQPEGRSRSVVW